MRGRRSMLWIVISLVAGVVCLGAVEPQPSKGGQAVSSVEAGRGLDGAPMVLIPAGPFTMGTHDGLPNERPEHTVTLDAYYIDRYEVTLGFYRKFLETGKHESPPTWDDEAAMTVGDRPAIGIKWKSADGYCRWAGKRLPSEAEWEKAARGTDGRRYPWGDMQPFVDIANYNRGMWVSEAITLVAVTSGLAGMSVRHGLKEGGKSPFGVSWYQGSIQTDKHGRGSRQFVGRFNIETFTVANNSAPATRNDRSGAKSIGTPKARNCRATAGNPISRARLPRPARTERLLPSSLAGLADDAGRFRAFGAMRGEDRAWLSSDIVSPPKP